MIDGPVINDEQWKDLQRDETLIDEITSATTEKEIKQIQKIYQRKQFGHDQGL